jgi:uncharacterized protein (DUF1330 family)
MSKVFTVVAYRSVSDADALASYAALAGPAIAAAGGRVIARGEPLATREAGLDQRVLIVEWDSLEQATAVYETEAYREALRRLDSTAERDIRIVRSLG